MKNKRILNIIIMLIFSLTSLSSNISLIISAASEECIIPIVSDKTSRRYIDGIKRDGNLYVSVEDMAEIIGGEVICNNKNYFITTRCSVKLFGGKNQSYIIANFLDAKDYSWDGVTLKSEKFIISPYFEENLIHIDMISYNNLLYVNFFEYLFAFNITPEYVDFEMLYNNVFSICAPEEMESLSIKEIKEFYNDILKVDFNTFDAFYLINVGTTLDELIFEFNNDKFAYQFELNNKGPIGVDATGELIDRFGSIIFGDNNLISTLYLYEYDRDSEYRDILLEILYADSLNPDNSEFESYSNTYNIIDTINKVLLATNNGLNEIDEIKKITYGLKILEHTENTTSTIMSTLDITSKYDTIQKQISELDDIQKNILQKAIIDNKNEIEYRNYNLSEILERIQETEGPLKYINLNLALIKSNVSKYEKLENEYSALYDSSCKINDYINNSEQVKKDKSEEIKKEISKQIINTTVSTVTDVIPELKPLAITLNVYDLVVSCANCFGVYESFATRVDASKAYYIMNLALDDLDLEDPDTTYYSFLLGLKASYVGFDKYKKLCNSESTKWGAGLYSYSQNMISQLLERVLNCRRKYYNAPLDGSWNDISSCYREDASVSKDKINTIIVPLEPVKIDYIDYLKSELIPKYGLYNSVEKQIQVDLSMPYISYGIIGIYVDDFNNDETEELLIARVQKDVDQSEEFSEKMCVILELYGWGKTEIKLLDRTELFSLKTNGRMLLPLLNYELLVSTDNNNNKNICVFDKNIYNTISSRIVFYTINSQNEFKANDLLIDPGYTSAVGLYYSSSVLSGSIPDVSYSDCEKEIFIYQAGTGTEYSSDKFYNAINEITSKHGVTVNPITSGRTNFSLQAHNGSSVFKMHYNPDNSFLNTETNLHKYLKNEYINANQNDYKAPVDLEKYIGKYKVKFPLNLQYNISVTIDKTSDYDKAIYFDVNYLNEGGTSLSQSKEYIYSDYNNGGLLFYYAHDEWGLNRYSFSFSDNKILLDIENIKANGSGSIPKCENIELIKDVDYTFMYKEILNEFKKQGTTYDIPMYDLYDIDSNGIPELFISSGETHMRSCYIYTLDNDKIIKIGSFGEYGSVGYDVVNKLIISHGGNNGTSFGSYFKLNDLEFTKMFSWFTNEDSTDNPEQKQYIINDVNVSKDEFIQKKSSILSDNIIYLGRGNKIS